MKDCLRHSPSPQPHPSVLIINNLSTVHTFVIHSYIASKHKYLGTEICGNRSGNTWCYCAPPPTPPPSPPRLVRGNGQTMHCAPEENLTLSLLLVVTHGTTATLTHCGRVDIHLVADTRMRVGICSRDKQSPTTTTTTTRTTRWARLRAYSTHSYTSVYRSRPL